MVEANEMKRENSSAEALDDRGTDVQGGLTLLQKLRDNGFDSDNQKFALALGRPVEEVEAWINGTEPPDDDILMKARGIAKQRGVEIE